MSKISINMTTGSLKPVTTTTEPEPVISQSLADITVDAQQLLDATEQFIIKHFGELKPADIAIAYKHTQQLKNAIAAKDQDKIQSAKALLDEISQPIIQRVISA